MEKFSFNDPNPQKKLDALEAFVEYWVGPRLPEFGATAEQLEHLRIPDPLRRLYNFCFNWPRENSQRWGIPLLSNQNVLIRPETTDKFPLEMPQGLVTIANENQGVTSWATLDEGDDPPVYGLDYEWGAFYISPDGKEHRRWTKISTSLSEFLVGFALYELCIANWVSAPTTIIEYIESHPERVTPLVDTTHGHPAKLSLFDNDVLVFRWDWEGPETSIIAARDDAALEKFQKFSGTITGVDFTAFIESEYGNRKWYVYFSADGSGGVTSSRTPKFLSRDTFSGGSLSFDEIVSQVEPHLCSEQSKECLSEVNIKKQVVDFMKRLSTPAKSYLPNFIIKVLFEQAITAIKNPSPELQEQLKNGSPLDW